MEQYINWPNVAATALRAATPIAENGTVANNGDAIGILAGDVCKSSGVQACQLIVAGRLELDAVESSFGARLTAACKDALCGIEFVPETPATLSLPIVTDADNGKILMVVNGVWTAVTP